MAPYSRYAPPLRDAADDAFPHSPFAPNALHRPHDTLFRRCIHTTVRTPQDTTLVSPHKACYDHHLHDIEARKPHTMTTTDSPPPPLPAPSILYRDATLVAVDKPAGIAAIAEHAGDRVCLRVLLEEHLQAPVWVVHRLDKAVSGLILFALDADTHRALNALFSERLIKKTYLAIVHGHVVGKSGTLRQPLHEFGSGRVGVDPRGKPAVTRYRVIQCLDAFTLLEVMPETGRRHQIRAHLYAMGHPIVGDLRYGTRDQQASFPRLMLHAAALTVPLPGRDPLQLACPQPPAFADWLAAQPRPT